MALLKNKFSLVLPEKPTGLLKLFNWAISLEALPVAGSLPIGNKWLCLVNYPLARKF
jgi:hypothetical protein